MTPRPRVGLLLAAALLATGCEVPRAQPSLTPLGRRALAPRPVERRAPEPAPAHRTIRALVDEHRTVADPRDADALADLVVAEARRAGIDPLMVAAVIARESSFRTHAVSHKGAVGLMQIRPFVARDLAARAGLEWNGIETLRRADVNVRLGTMYLRELFDEFDDPHVALSAYHRGPSRVRGQLREGTFGPGRYAESVLRLRSELAARAAALDPARTATRVAAAPPLRAG